MSRGTTPRTHILALGGEQVRVLEWPGEAPTFVAWPGLGGTAEYFGMLADRVPFRLAALDPPGVGPVSTSFRTGPRWTGSGGMRSAGGPRAAGRWWS